MISKINRSNYLRAYCEPATTDCRNLANTVVATHYRALFWSYCVKPEVAQTKLKAAIKTME